MLSQCPQCRAIFNVSAPAIEAHHGLVRCGHCRAIFHAVTNEVTGLEPPGEASPTPVRETPIQGLDTAASGGDDRDAVAREAEESTFGPDTFPEPESVQGPEDSAEPVPFPEPDPPPDTTWSPSEPEWDTVPAEDREPEADPYAIPGDEPGDGFDEPTLPEPAEEEAQDTPPPELPGEVEEILIEAPPTLPPDFDRQFADGDTGPVETPAAGDSPAEYRQSSSPAGGSSRSTAAPAPRETAPAEQQDITAAGSPLQSPYRARDIRMVELPQPRPFKTATLSLLAVFLVLLLVWQVRTFYLDELAQVPLLRPYLEEICRPLGCTIPPRRDFARIELESTSISINPEVPGALEIRAGLVNQAHFPQPYPPLRVTLTDREGRVVGRRTYAPGDYRPNADSDLLPARQQRDVTINLANPERDVVGYEVELVTPRD